jgi:TetR/AcrR family transcriptional repressor of nem operon
LGALQQDENMLENVERPPRRSRAESKEATRQALLEAGLAELIEHGLDVPSLDAICARAGYTRGAFYVHFKDREDFFVAVMDWALSGILLGVVGANGHTDLRSAVSRFASYMSHREWPVVGKYPLASHRLIEAISRSEQLKARWAEVFRKIVEGMAALIARAQERGEARKSLNPHDAAEAIVTMGLGAMGLQDTGVTRPESQLIASVMALLSE